MRMRGRGWMVAGVIAVGAAGVVSARAAMAHEDAARARQQAGAIRAAAALREQEAARGEADIRFFQARVAQDPYGAADRARLSTLYAQRARETGDYDDY
ncbi:MAG TPA: hypothetical protein VFJ16_25990, partial [Longimicrobium sp.]|nr:hypothetical protein [Longimicrobium sp.]